jgi:hypothetical protein
MTRPLEVPPPYLRSSLDMDPDNIGTLISEKFHIRIVCVHDIVFAKFPFNSSVS